MKRWLEYGRRRRTQTPTQTSRVTTSSHPNCFHNIAYYETSKILKFTRCKWKASKFSTNKIKSSQLVVAIYLDKKNKYIYGQETCIHIWIQNKFYKVGVLSTCLLVFPRYKSVASLGTFICVQFHTYILNFKLYPHDGTYFSETRDTFFGFFNDIFPFTVWSFNFLIIYQ